MRLVSQPPEIAYRRRRGAGNRYQSHWRLHARAPAELTTLGRRGSDDLDIDSKTQVRIPSAFLLHKTDAKLHPDFALRVMRIPVLKSRSTRPHRGSLIAWAIAKLRRARWHGSPLRWPSSASRRSWRYARFGRPENCDSLVRFCDAVPAAWRRPIALPFACDSPVRDGGRSIRRVVVIRFAPRRYCEDRCRNL